MHNYSSVRIVVADDLNRYLAEPNNIKLRVRRGFERGKYQNNLIFELEEGVRRNQVLRGKLFKGKER